MIASLALALVAAAPVSGGVHLWTEAKGPRLRGMPDVPALVRAALPGVVGIVATTAHPLGGGDPFHDFQRRIWGSEEGESASPTRGIGTGFFVRPDGLIATNAHVVEGATDVAVHVGPEAESERVYRGVVIGFDESTDLALVRIEGGPFPVLPLGDSDAAEVGEPVVAIGSPFGLSRSVTTGIVSSKGRRDVNPSGRPGYYDFIQTDAAINPGNSGGPLLDARGAVIAIDAAVSPSGQGIGFAVPINMLKELMPQLVARGSVQRGWIGLSIQEQLTPELAESLAVPGGRGVLVTEVAAGGPAQEAGLRPGDVITAFERDPVGEAWRLRWLTSLSTPGRPVNLTVWRAGKPTTAALVPRPKASEPPPMLEIDASRGADGPFGMAVAARKQGEPHGVQISALDLRGPAYRAGLREGDLLLEADGKPLEDAKDFAQASAAPAAVTRFFVHRGARALFFGVRRDRPPQAERTPGPP